MAYGRLREEDKPWNHKRVYSVYVALGLPLRRKVKKLINKKGKPQRIRIDNGPEFNAHIINDWGHIHKIEFKYIQRGKHTQKMHL